MPRSTPVFATAELPPLATRDAGAEAAATLWLRVLRSRRGAVGAFLLLLISVMAVVAPLLATGPFAITGGMLEPPSWHHLMGTDALGRDLLSGVLYGARASLAVAFVTGASALAIGLCVGLCAGYSGGWVDGVLMRATEIMQVIPRFFLAVLAVALFGPGLDRIIIVFAVTSWPALARVIRAEALSLRTEEFVLASEAAGASALRIMRRELLPNVVSVALVMLGLMIGQVLLLEASLGFLGLGDPDVASWGALVSQGRDFLLVAWWLPVFPGVAILISVLGLNLVGDAASAEMQR